MNPLPLISLMVVINVALHLAWTFRLLLAPEGVRASCDLKSLACNSGAIETIVRLVQSGADVNGILSAIGFAFEILTQGALAFLQLAVFYHPWLAGGEVGQAVAWGLSVIGAIMWLAVLFMAFVGRR